VAASPLLALPATNQASEVCTDAITTSADRFASKLA
jgi:hypothetical protein